MPTAKGGRHVKRILELDGFRSTDNNDKYVTSARVKSGCISIHKVYIINQLSKGSVFQFSN